MEAHGLGEQDGAAEEISRRLGKRPKRSGRAEHPVKPGDQPPFSQPPQAEDSGGDRNRNDRENADPDKERQSGAVVAPQNSGAPEHDRQIGDFIGDEARQHGRHGDFRGDAPPNETGDDQHRAADPAAWQNLIGKQLCYAKRNEGQERPRVSGITQGSARRRRRRHRWPLEPGAPETAKPDAPIE